MGNGKNFKEGMKEAKRIISNDLNSILDAYCEAILEHAIDNREFQGFTGNTQTSYSCGLYKDGSLIYVYHQREYTRKPIRKKVKKGERTFLGKPYEGNKRSVIGRVDVDDKYGSDTAEEFLKSYNVENKNGFSVVVTTGTEYSEYLENVRELNVLTETYEESDRLFNQITRMFAS